MSKVKIQGNASGTGVLTITAPNTSTDRTITLPDSTGTLATTADNGSQLDHSGTKKIEAVSTGAQIQNRLEVITPNDSSTHLVQRLGSTDGSYGYVDLELVSPNSTDANLPRLDVQIGNSTVASFIRGGGIALGGTGAANTLHDYEEGTWTPVIGGTSESGQSYAEQTGKYVKIGGMVFCHGYVALSTEGTISGFARLKGFPFTLSGGNNSAVTFGYTKQFGLSADHILEGWVYGSNVIYLYEADHQDDNPTQISSGHILNTSAFAFSFFFSTTD